MPDGTSLDTPSADSTSWQYWVIDVLKRHERDAGRTAPSRSGDVPVPRRGPSRAANDPLWRSPADWISPGFDDADAPFDSRLAPTDPPAQRRRARWFISDTDHYSPMDADKRCGPGSRSCAATTRSSTTSGSSSASTRRIHRPACRRTNHSSRRAWRSGDTRRLADRIGLIDMVPVGDLASTGYALANPGVEYVVLHPEGGELTVQLPPGSYDVEWFNLETREWTDGEPVSVDTGAATVLRPPVGSSASVTHLM